MKTTTLLIFLFIMTNASANYKKAQKLFLTNAVANNDKIMNELIDSGLYFSAVPFSVNMIERNNKLTSEEEATIEKLLLKTGIDHYTSLPTRILKNSTSISLKVVLAFKLFNQNNIKGALKYSSLIKSDHRFAPEATMLKASSLQILGKNKSALSTYDECISTSESFKNKSEHEKLKRYYAIISETCSIHKARIYYKSKMYKKAIEEYDSIGKTSYRWPYLLIEKAWANYYLEDFNRSLGLLVTYKSPLLSSYFMPETETLQALSYYRLCLWDDSLKVIDHYYKTYKVRSEKLKEILLPNKNSPDFFRKLAFTPIHKNEKKNFFIRNLLTQIRKKIRFSVDMVTYKKSIKEYKKLKTIKGKFSRYLRKEVKGLISWKSQSINHFVKKNMFSFINEIHEQSYELFNIKLEILSKKRNYLYKHSKVAQERARGSYENVNRRKDQFFWHYNGSFWADELGDYSFGLKSNCETNSVAKR